MKRVWLLLFGMSILFCFAACAAEEPSECNHKYIIKSEIESTCTERGVVIYGCQKCDECYQEELPVLGHTREVVAAVPATCVNSGLTEGSYCSTCGEILEAQIEVSTIDHSYKDGQCKICGRVQASEGLEFTNWGDYYIVTGIGTCTESNVVIPDTYNSLPVLGIGEYAFCESSNLISVVIPDSIVNIEKYAFRDCSNLESVTIGNNVTNIELGAFMFCTDLSIVTIGDSVTNIGKSAFLSCESLTDIVLPDGIVTIGDYAFYGCSNLTNVIIGQSVAKIGCEVFRSCPLTTVTFKETSGWYVSRFETENSGTSVEVSDLSTVFFYLTNSYYLFRNN